LSIKRPICSLTERYMMWVQIVNFKRFLIFHSFIRVPIFNPRKALIFQAILSISIEQISFHSSVPHCNRKLSFFRGGPHKWRDFMIPSQILDEYCVANGISLPSYSSDGSVCIIGKYYKFEEVIRPDFCENLSG
jgi:hypothetical protein